MSILTIDTSTKSGSISIWLSSEESVDLVGDPSITHGERLPSDIANVLERGKIGLADIEIFGVGIGPGSFTGLRVGIATAQALALTQGRKVVPVPTLDAVAAARMNENIGRPSLGSKDNVLPDRECTIVWMDGQRGQVFAAVYVRGSFDSGILRPKRVAGPQVGDPAIVLDAMTGILEDFGHGLVVKVVGTATARDKELLETRLTDMTAGLSIGDGESVLAPVMARLVAARQYEAVSPDKLQPLYIRRPDAVLARERKASGE
ncbi:tRNA (adenosine(37)-N6)-threonylcarbamoyltransferase complex dimerization subunit type 1 TsaB [bacterium]|nr:MAG: tRNA (adenosine(37)-N6)-threonylcarbamoyltransferase complex dimerization subunit type 1 TsaB [bacterium]